MYYLISSSLKKLDFCVRLENFMMMILYVLPSGMSGEALKIFNSYNKKLKFTNEEEQSNQITFRNILVMRKCDGELLKHWPSKATTSGRLLNYLSNHQINQKIRTFRQLFYRVHHLSTIFFKT